VPETFEPKVYRAGILAYVDTFSGLVPCKVLRVIEPCTLSVTSGRIEVKLTATRGAYKRGEVLIETGQDVVPRERVYVRAYQQRIQNGFVWHTDS
jgi:hypothetical protein